MDNMSYYYVMQDLIDRLKREEFIIEVTLTDGDQVRGVPRLLGINVLALDNPDRKTFYVPLSSIVLLQTLPGGGPG